LSGVISERLMIAAAAESLQASADLAAGSGSTPADVADLEFKKKAA